MNLWTSRRTWVATATATAVCLATANAASTAPVGAEHATVVNAQHLASRVGVDVLKDGGNAVDAAVAVGYALAVVYPAAGNLGGGGFMTLQLADGRKTFLDFREKAPLAASANMYLGPDGNVVEGLSTNGHLAVGVPGTVPGLEYALSRCGTMKRASVMAPAIRYAERGFVLDAGDVATLATATGLTIRRMTEPAAPPPPPDRLSTDPLSPHHVAAVFEHTIGIRLNGKERFDVEEYCINEGWVKVAAGKTRDRKGRPLLITPKGTVEAFYR